MGVGTPQAIWIAMPSFRRLRVAGAGNWAKGQSDQLIRNSMLLLHRERFTFATYLCNTQLINM